jgi:UDP-N-acetylglucosamine 4-epimerase
MTRYAECLRALESGASELWLVTGAAGFIGSHLVERLLASGQRVRGLDDFSTGKRDNLDAVRAAVGDEAWRRFELVQGDCAELDTARTAVAGARHVLHQAALASVPRSIADPLATLRANVQGFASLLVAAHEAHVARVVYASSSSVYGDRPGLPKRETELGEPLSPYAASKRMDEVLAAAFGRAFELETVGLRYFNVFGPRQDPDGPYAAVIPRWIAALSCGEQPVLHGDGSTTRDFCPVSVAVQANLLAALASGLPRSAVYNVALGQRTSLRELYLGIQKGLVARGIAVGDVRPLATPFRPGDVTHSLADIARARVELGLVPAEGFEEGLARTLQDYLRRGERA